VHVVVETALDGRPVTEAAPVATLQGLAQNVGRRVPENGLGVVVVELEQFQTHALLQRPVQVPHLTVHLQARPKSFTIGFNRIERLSNLIELDTNV